VILVDKDIGTLEKAEFLFEEEAFKKNECQNRSVLAQIKLKARNENLVVLAVHLKSGTKDQDVQLRIAQMEILEKLCDPLPKNLLMLGDINEELFVKNTKDENTLWHHLNNKLKVETKK